jgi:hypothetical protein
MQRSAKPPEIHQPFFCPREWNTHPVKQVDDLRGHIGHSFDRRLVGKKVAAIDSVVEMFCRGIALALCINGAVYPALGADRVRSFYRHHRDQIDVVPGLGDLHCRGQAREASANDRDL